MPDPTAEEVPASAEGEHLSPATIAGGLVVGVAAVSSAAVLIRLADAHPLAVAFWRTAGGTGLLAPAALRARRNAPRLQAVQWAQLTGAGVALAAHFALWIISLDYTTVASSVTLVTASPLFVGLGAAVFLGEPPRRRTWIGMAVTLVGALLIGVGDLQGLELGRRAVAGDALALGGAVAVSGYFLTGRAARRQLPVSVYATVVYAVAAAVLLPVCVAAGAELGGYTAGTWLALVGLVIGPQLLGHTVFNKLLAVVTATVVSIVVLAEPVGATLLAWLVLGELPAPLFWAGAPLILVGVGAATTRRRSALPLSE